MRVKINLLSIKTDKLSKKDQTSYSKKFACEYTRCYNYDYLAPQVKCVIALSVTYEDVLGVIR